MKKYILTIMVIVGLAANLNAQSDGFFNNSKSGYRSENSNELLPMLPKTYNSLNDYDATGKTPDEPAPLGSGLLILTGLAVAYSRKKKE
jgi:hypothetical protein